MGRKPWIGITPDVLDRNGSVTSRVAESYAVRIEQAGGVPVVLSPDAALVGAYVGRLDGFVLTGGDDPVMEVFGEDTHSQSVRVHPRRQSFELALLGEIRERAEAGCGIPTLGVCLGMQYMGLAAGGSLDQHMPETLGTSVAASHWESDHAVEGIGGVWGFGEGKVHSKHRQRLADAGSLEVLACSPDGVIEAVGDPGQKFYLGVQWHPERTSDSRVGQAIFDALVSAARDRSLAQGVGCGS